jgi:hypothetical protein
MVADLGVSLGASWYSGCGLSAWVNGGLVVVEWVAALASAGGSALIGAAATDAWNSARDGVLALFGRSGDRRREVAAARLDADAAQIEAAPAAERDTVRARVLPGWQTRLADLLEEYPEAREELQAWVQRVLVDLRAGEQAGGVSVFAGPGSRVFTGDAYAEAKDGGIAFGQVGGDVYTGGAGRGPTDPPGPGRSGH